MALFPIYDFFIINGKIKSVSEFIPSENNGGVYEVLRVVNGTPLFLEDHFLRLLKSSQIAGKNVNYSELEIRNFLNLLIQKNKVKNENLLISFKTNLKIFFIAHNYPLVEMYTEGVECGILHAERENPNAKVFQTSVRKKANEMILGKGLYEVILVDNQGRITEGSRSNLFFVKGNQIITSPGNNVLLGITRQKTIQLAQELGFAFLEKEVFLDELSIFESVFITGTSPKILPVNKIGNVAFNPQNEILQMLISRFNQLIESYINKFSG
ncbi:MAG: aminotransferase class IV [Bacteroidetes bacterium]|nr:aminotransferase class IV [Bacteroidota bacterium]